MRVDGFRQMYLTELQELRSVEKQLTTTLPQLANDAENGVRDFFKAHESEARSYLDRLDRIIEKHDGEPDAHADQSMGAMLQEARKLAGMVSDQILRDAALLASAQRVKHYQIAVYGTLASWAQELGLNDEKHELANILDEQKRADERLSILAMEVVNREAAAIGGG